jgi:hypothetical protein
MAVFAPIPRANEGTATKVKVEASATNRLEFFGQMRGEGGTARACAVMRVSGSAWRRPTTPRHGY